MPHLVLEVLRITLVYRYGNSSPRYSVRTITPFLIHYLKVSQVSKYEISITLLLILFPYVWKGMPQSKHKGSDFIGIAPVFFVKINVLIQIG